MGFNGLVVYAILLYLHPADFYPVLLPYKLTLWTSLLGPVIAAIEAYSIRCLVWVRQCTLLVCLTLVMIISLLVSDRWLGGTWFVLQDFGTSIALFFLAIWTIRTWRRMRLIATTIVALSLAVSIQGIVAFHFGYDTERFITAENGADEDDDAAEASRVEGASRGGLLRIKSVGMMEDPNDLASGLIVALPLVLMSWRRKRILANILAVGIPGAILLYALYLTRSRGAMVALLGIIVMKVRSHHGNVIAVVATSIVAVGLMAVNFTGGRGFSSGEESAAGRIDAWSEGLQMARENPILGVGYRNFTVHNALTAHNSIVLCFAELGVVGSFIWVGLISTTFMDLAAVADAVQLSSLQQEPDILRWVSTIRTCLIGFLICAFFLSRTYMFLLYLILGLAVATTQLAAVSGHKTPRLPTDQFLRVTGAWQFGSIGLVYIIVRFNHLIGAK